MHTCLNGACGSAHEIWYFPLVLCLGMLAIYPDPSFLLCAQVVMCSGVMNDGSLRIVRNGIGMIEQASVELPGIKGMWNLRATNMDAFDKYLVLSFVGETRILAINEDDELDEAEVAGFNQQSQVPLLLLKALMIVVASTIHQACRSLHEKFWLPSSNVRNGYCKAYARMCTFALWQCCPRSWSACGYFEEFVQRKT